MSKQSQDVKQIHYFHCTPDRSDYLLPYPNMLRILASAYRIKKFPRILRHLSLARELFIDSGMISAHKKGEYEWQYQQAFVVEVSSFRLRFCKDFNPRITPIFANFSQCFHIREDSRGLADKKVFI